MLPAIKVFLISAFLRVTSCLPLRVLHGLGRLVGAIAFRLNTHSARITRRNLEICFPNRSDAEREALLRRSLQETAKTAFELGRIWLAPLQQVLAEVTQVTGEELMQESLAAGKGVIVLAPHQGSWELYGLMTSSYAPTTYLYKPPKLAGFEEAMTRYRTRAGAKLVPTNRQGVVQLLKALERGEIVGILPDQEPDLSGGVFAPFFGKEALTMTLAGRLAEKTGAAVLCGFVRRLPRGSGFEAVYQRADSRVASADPLESATALNATVEACVLEEPTQYQWEYKRFRRRPQSEPDKVYL